VDNQIHGNYLNEYFKIADLMREESNVLCDLACIFTQVHSEREREREREKEVRITEKKKAKLQKRKLLTTIQSTVQQAHKFPSCLNTLKT
jgi:hypothetical protein